MRRDDEPVGGTSDPAGTGSPGLAAVSILALLLYWPYGLTALPILALSYTGLTALRPYQYWPCPILAYTGLTALLVLALPYYWPCTLPYTGPALYWPYGLIMP